MSKNGFQKPWSRGTRFDESYGSCTSHFQGKDLQTEILETPLLFCEKTFMETQLMVSNDCKSPRNSHDFSSVLQAKGVLKFIEAISEKTLRSTVALTAARGRGKSAALGLAVAGAVAFGCGFAT